MATGTAGEVVLELFVRGYSLHSAEAIKLVRNVCEAKLRGGFRLDVIDIVEQPERVRDAGVMVAPALVRRKPEPVLRTVGQLTEARVVEGLGLA